MAPFKAMPQLVELDMAKNMMISLSGWESLPMLKKLHLRRNKIDKIEDELPPLESLEYLDLESNNILTMKVLSRVFQFATLKNLNVTNNPVNLEMSHFNVLMSEVLCLSPKLVTFCEVEVEEGHRLEAIFLAQYRHDV